MDYQNLNTLISSRDFAQPWAFPPPPKEPAQSAPKAAWDKYWEAMDAYYERYGETIKPKDKKTIFGSIKGAASKVSSGVGKQFTDPKSALQRTAARGLVPSSDSPCKASDTLLPSPSGAGRSQPPTWRKHP